jgi:hypothetical protein
MNYNFTGSITQRKINLGSAHEISSQQLAQQAREERAIRFEIRQRHAAATKIQSAVRGRKAAQSQRQHLRKRLQDIGSIDFTQATSIVNLATQRHAIFTRLEKLGPRAILSKSEQEALAADHPFLVQWLWQALDISQNSSEYIIPFFFCQSTY